MINDYSEITATLQSKIYDMHRQFNEKKLFPTLEVLQEINKDIEKLIDHVTNLIEAKRE